MRQFLQSLVGAGTVGAVDGADFVVDTLYLQFTGGDGRLPPPAPDAVAARALGREAGGDHLKVTAGWVFGWVGNEQN